MKKILPILSFFILFSCGGKKYKLTTVCYECNKTQTENRTVSPLEKEKTELLKRTIEKPFVPIRLDDQEVRILVLPYVDEYGDFHQGEYIYTVLRNGKWIFSREKLGRKPVFKISEPLRDKK